MADIAMLVAEEYERRVKQSKESGEGIILMDTTKISASLCWMKEKMREKIRVERVGKGKAESQITAAACSGFFSA